MPTPVFSDNFESGNLNLWSTNVSNGTVAASTEQAFEGTYSLKAAVTSAGGYAQVKNSGSFNVGNGGNLWVTGRAYVPANFAVTGETILFQVQEQSSPYKMISVRVNSSQHFDIYNAVSTNTLTSTVAIPTGRWFSYRFYMYVGASGYLSLDIDDTHVIAQSNNTLAGSNWTKALIGVFSAAGDTPTVYHDYIRISNSTIDPSVPTGYYKSGFTTQPNDAFANSQRLLVSPIVTAYYPMAYHLYEGTSRMGYDSYTDIVYIRAPSDADPATQTIEIPQRDNGIYINNQSSVTLKNISVQQTNDKTYGGIRITGPGGSHTIDSVDASYNADAGLEIDGASANNTITGGTFNNNLRYGIRLYQSNNNSVTNTMSGGTLVNINGALIAQQSDNALFDSNTINDTVGYAVDCYSSANITMKNNTATNPQNGGYTVEGSCTDFLIENNTVTNAILAGGIMVIPTVAGSCSGTIQYNTIINSLDGIWLNDHIADNTIIQYNIVRNTKSTTTHGDIAVRIADGVKIYNNTLVNGGGDGIAFFSNGLDAPDNSLVKNNIVYGNTGYSLNVSSGTVFNGTGNVWDYNDYYKSSGNVFSWAGTSYTSAQFLNYKNASTQDSNSIISDPNLVNIAGGILNLSRTSPAINVGVDVGLTKDFVNTSVPQGSKPDIGAYEYIPLTVTINQAAGQLDPSNSSTTNFTVIFSESVVDFATGDVTLSGTAGATTATVTGSGTTYNVAVSGMTGSGTVIASIAADRATGATGNTNAASMSTDNTVTYDNTAPSSGSITYTDGVLTSTSVALTVSDGTDSTSGVNTSSRTVQRKSATLSGDTCGSYGSFATISPTGSYPNFIDTTVPSGSCDQYQYLVSDNAGNQASYTSSNVAKILFSAPGVSVCGDTTPTGTIPWLYEANANNGNSITLRFTNWQSPVDHFALEYGTKSNNYQYAANNIGGNGTNSYTVNFLSPNTTYYFRVRAGNGCATGTWSNEISAKTKGLISTNQLEITQSELIPQPVSSEQQTSNNGSCQTYTVKSGDNLWNISNNLLGDGNKYKDIATQNKGQYPSLETSNIVRVGWELKVNCGSQPSPTSTTPTTSGAGETQKTNGTQPQTGYDVKVKVSDTSKKPVEGATVTLHSIPQTTKTDQTGLAIFHHVEQGDHQVLIAYNGFQGQQSINLSGDVKEFDLNVTVQKENILLSPQVEIIVGALILIIAFLSFKLIKKNKIPKL